MATKKYLDDTGLSYFWSKIKALIPTTWAASSTANGVATKAASIPFGQVDSTSTSTVFTATVNGITELSDGVCVMLKNGVVTSASGWTLNINDLGAKPVYRSFAASSRTTTWFNVNYTMLFVYNSTRITGGCWDMFEGYWSDSNNVGVYNRPTYVRLKTKTNLYRYQMLLSYSDTELLPINAVSNDTGTSKTLTTESFDPFGPIYYYYNENTVNADTVIPDSRLWAQRDMNLRYSFNTGTTLTANKSIYLVAVPQNDGKAKLYSAPISQEIPATDNGLIYIYLGTAYSNYQLQLNEKHPIYYYKDGAVRLWTNAAETAGADNYYATCSSASSSTAKELAATNIPTPFAGMHLSVKFTNGFVSTPVSLFWNNTYLGDVVSSGTTTGIALDVRPDQMVELVYDGTYWHCLNIVEATTDYYGITRLTNSVTSNSTDTAATPKSVKQAYDLANSQKTTITTDNVTATNIYSDGKQVYVKRFTITAFPDSSTSSHIYISTGISESVSLFEIKGVAKYGNPVSTTYPVPYSNRLMASYDNSTKQLDLYSPTNYGSYYGYIDFYFTYD